MSITVLYIATAAMCLLAIAGTWQRAYQMPGWFGNPPASLGLIGVQNRKLRQFTRPLSILFFATGCAALLFYREVEEIRNHILTALACYITAGLLTGIYFTRELMAFSAMPENTPQTPELLRRTRRWLRWTVVRDVLYWLAAISMILACSNL